VSFDGTANITVPSDIAPGTSGNVLTSNGTVWTSAAPTGGSGAETGDIKFVLDSATVGAGWGLTGVNGIPAFTTPDADYKAVIKMAGTVATPTASPAAGEVADGSTITFSSTTPGVTFVRKTDGSDPARGDGTTGGTATLSGDTTYKVRAYIDGQYLADSAVATFAYTIPSGFSAYYSAEFDGTNDYLLRGAGLTGAANTTGGAVSFWMKMLPGSANSTQYTVASTSGQNSFEIRRDTAGAVQFVIRNTSATVLVNIKSSNSVFTNASGWKHVMASWTTSGTAVAHLYINGVADLTATTLTTGTCDYDEVNWSIGATHTGTGRLPALLSEYYFATSYVDLSNSSNRALFINTATTKPAGDLLTNGAPAPIVYLRNQVGASPSWHTNAGSGGGFSLTGTLVDGGSDKP
jgi:hypothetical protein